jgi:hypothetical protein
MTILIYFVAGVIKRGRWDLSRFFRGFLSHEYDKRGFPLFQHSVTPIRH